MDRQESGAVSALQAYRNGKFKETQPENTVKRIRGILNEYHIPVEERILRSGIDDICSCRITVKGTSLGQNGKGTSPDYALASGYAEFMERLSTGYLFPYRAPDATDMTVEEAAEKGGILLVRMLSHIYSLPEEIVRPHILLKPWSDEGKITCYPFQSLSDGSTAMLPELLYRGFAFTDGSCCGNTREEALVQGLSEIMERYATEQILRNRLTPPLIPEEELKKIPELFGSIRALEQKSGCRVLVFDASLGKGLPAVGVLLRDSAAGRAGVRFGAHPRFEVALERTLTELLQGRASGDLIAEHYYGEEYEALADTPLNIFNIIKGSNGVLSNKLVRMDTMPSDWNYAPFDTVSGGNCVFWEWLLSLSGKLGWDVYMRDCSFFGFPAYHVTVPQSLLLCFGKISLAQNQEKHRYGPLLRDLPHASAADWQKALRTMKLFSGFAIHESLDYVCGLPLGCRLFGWDVNYELLSALFAIRQRDYAAAAGWLQRYQDVSAEFTQLFRLCTQADTNSPADSPDAGSRLSAGYVFDDPFSILPECTWPDCTACRRKPECEYHTVMQDFPGQPVTGPSF